MGWGHFFAISVFIIFVLQGIHFIIKKKIYIFKSPLTPVMLACFLTLILTIVQTTLRKFGAI